MRYYFVVYLARKGAETFFGPSAYITGNCLSVFVGTIVLSAVKSELEKTGLLDVVITNFIEMDEATYLANQPTND